MRPMESIGEIQVWAGRRSCQGTGKGREAEYVCLYSAGAAVEYDEEMRRRSCVIRVRGKREKGQGRYGMVSKRDE